MPRKRSSDVADRFIYLNDPEHNLGISYVANTIRTCKYSLWSFLPLFLFEQFRRYANIFFLIQACIQVDILAVNAVGVPSPTDLLFPS